MKTEEIAFMDILLFRIILFTITKFVLINYDICNIMYEYIKLSIIQID